MSVPSSVEVCPLDERFPIKTSSLPHHINPEDSLVIFFFCPALALMSAGALLSGGQMAASGVTMVSEICDCRAGCCVTPY